MKNILEIMRRLNAKDWYYYYQVLLNELKNPFSQNIGDLEFIKSYFRKSG